jgi:hypothetical protein
MPAARCGGAEEMPMTTRQLLAAACATLLLAAPAFAQVRVPDNREAALRATFEAAAARSAALVEAEKRRPRIAGIWRIETPVSALQTTAGKLPPLNKAAQALYRQRVAERKTGRTSDPVEQCTPPGTPRVLWVDAPFLITQAPAKLTIFHQHRHLIRHVFLDGPLKLDDPEPTWEGYSSGEWRGNTLVIETAGFNGKQWLDLAGLPQSATMKVTERLHLLSPDRLEDEVTIEDGAYYTAAWTARAVFRRLPDDTDLPEEECSEKLLEFPLRNYAPQ